MSAEKRKLQRQVFKKKQEYLQKLNDSEPKVKIPCSSAAFEVLEDPSRRYILNENEENESVTEAIIKIRKTQEENSSLLISLSEQNKKIVEFLAETNVLLKRSLGLLVNKFDTYFPLHDEEGLKLLEEQLQTNSKQEIISVIKGILKDNLKCNITGVFHEDLILKYNFDGVKEKKPLKSFENIINALFAASSFKLKDEFISEIRTSLKTQKNRIHKAQNRKKMNNGRETSNNSTQ